MIKITRNIVNFFELPEEWQKEAISNLDEYAEAAMYLEPDIDSNPVDHILWDLSECMHCEGIHEGFNYNCSIGISNNSAMLLNINDSFEVAETVIV